MVVAVVAMWVVQVATHEVIDMVAMLDRRVTASGAVLMVVL